MILSVKIMLYNFFIRAFVPFVLIPANKLRFGITPDQETSLNNHLLKFTTNFDLYTDPAKHSEPVINDTNVAYQNAMTVVEGVRKQIKSNSTVELSGLDLVILNIPVSTPRRNHVNVPDKEPVVVCVMKSPLLMRFIAFDPTNPFKRAKPADVEAIGIKTAIVPTGSLPPNIKDYVIQTPENNTEFEILFNSAQVGQTFYIICYYLNNRNEAGKDGLPFSITII